MRMIHTNRACRGDATLDDARRDSRATVGLNVSSDNEVVTFDSGRNLVGGGFRVGTSNVLVTSSIAMARDRES